MLEPARKPSISHYSVRMPPRHPHTCSLYSKVRFKVVEEAVERKSRISQESCRFHELESQVLTSTSRTEIPPGILAVMNLLTFKVVLTFAGKVRDRIPRISDVVCAEAKKEASQKWWVRPRPDHHVTTASNGDPPCCIPLGIRRIAYTMFFVKQMQFKSVINQY